MINVTWKYVHILYFCRLTKRLISRTIGCDFLNKNFLVNPQLTFNILVNEEKCLLGGLNSGLHNREHRWPEQQQSKPELSDFKYIRFIFSIQVNILFWIFIYFPPTSTSIVKEWSAKTINFPGTQ
jgi:hypothetical protein